MTKKMLLTAVGDYQGFAQKLEAPVEELDRWEALLSSAPFGLTVQGKPLKDATATRANILNGLDLLLANAQPDDQLLFLMLCHGSIADGTDQALIAYPDGDPDLRKAAITFTDVAERLHKYRPHRDVDLTFLIDSCFAEGFGPPDAIPLFIKPTRELLGKAAKRGDRGRIRRFSDLASWRLMREDDSVPEPVLLTAAEEDQAAFEFMEGKKRRLLFSFRAINELLRNHHTFDDLVTAINPLRQGYPQKAVVHGSADRRAEKFPGEPERKTGVQSSRDAVATEAPIRMRILGLGCFIPPKTGGEVFANRIVLPYDTIGTGTMHHEAFVEVAEEDTTSFTGNLAYERYQRGGVYYRRWTLTEHRVLLANADESQGFSRSALFERHVPSMPQVCPELDLPRFECHLSHPVPHLFSGFVDLFSGSVDIGQLERTPTLFTRQYGDTPTNWGPERTPRSVIATLPFVGKNAILLIGDIAARTTAQIFIKPGSMIMAGNAREADITGNGSGETPREHFLIYYNLAPSLPDNPGLPSVSAVPIDACSVVKWP